MICQRSFRFWSYLFPDRLSNEFYIWRLFNTIVNHHNSIQNISIPNIDQFCISITLRFNLDWLKGLFYTLMLKQWWKYLFYLSIENELRLLLIFTVFKRWKPVGLESTYVNPFNLNLRVCALFFYVCAYVFVHPSLCD